MKMVLKLLITCIICLGAIMLIYILGVLLYAFISEFKPPQIEEITIQKKGKESINAEQNISILSWNIGYGGLGKEMDFFYEGGQKVKPDEVLSKKYLTGITDFLIKQDTNDLILLQEVDFNSNRSYGVNQADSISTFLTEFNKTSAVNYLSKYIPVPFFNPMGKVNSGLVTWSKYSPLNAKRASTPGKYSLPKRLFLLKRCLLITRYDVDNGKELIIINLHNSAFDDAHELRKEEMNYIKQIITSEFEKGNYVIAGGDWNQNPPKLNLDFISKYKTRSVWPMDQEFLPQGWNWAFDSSVPTNRDVHEPFNLQSTTCTILDYFVTSPNIEVLETRTIDIEFEFSDHQPVLITFKFK